MRDKKRDLEKRPAAEIADAPPEPPIVARLVIEIRSDGTRTIARGAMEDVTLGHRVSMQAEGKTPLSLAANLAKAILKAPILRRLLK